MNLVAGWCSRIQFLGSGLRGNEAPSHHTQLRQRAKGRMYISKSSPEHLPLHVKNNNGMPEHFPYSSQLCPAPVSLPHKQILSSPPGSRRMGRMGVPGYAHLALLCPPLLLQQTEGTASLQTIPQCWIQQGSTGKCLHHLFNPQIVGRGNRTRRDERVDEDRGKPAGLLPTLRGTWMGVGCPRLACFPRCCSWGHDPRTCEPLVGPMTDAPWG